MRKHDHMTDAQRRIQLLFRNERESQMQKSLFSHFAGSYDRARIGGWRTGNLEDRALPEFFRKAFDRIEQQIDALVVRHSSKEEHTHGTGIFGCNARGHARRKYAMRHDLDTLRFDAEPQQRISRRADVSHESSGATQEIAPSQCAE